VPPPSSSDARHGIPPAVAPRPALNRNRPQPVVVCRGDARRVLRELDQVFDHHALGVMPRTMQLSVACEF